AAHVGHAQHPGLRARHRRRRRQRQDLHHLVKGGHQPALAETEADAAPVARRLHHLRPTGFVRQRALLVVEQDIEGIGALGGLLRLGHGVVQVPGTYLRMAESSSSRVKGLVRYCSEPTMRPRALSNRPSLEDSMMTGVCLNIWLFLISAQVW